MRWATVRPTFSRRWPSSTRPRATTPRPARPSSRRSRPRPMTPSSRPKPRSSRPAQPPPPRPPQRDPDGLDEAVRELAEHGERALNLIKTQADELDRSLPPDNTARQYQQISADYINSMVQIARDMTRQARATTDPTLRRATINGALGARIYGCAQITNQLLNFPALP